MRTFYSCIWICCLSFIICLFIWHVIISQKFMHHWCLKYYETIFYILSIWWGVNFIPFSLNIFHMSGCVDHPFSLECLNNIIELSIKLPWKMVVVALFNCEILEWCVVANPCMVIKEFSNVFHKYQNIKNVFLMYI